jgi:hypothetical protein
MVKATFKIFSDFLWAGPGDQVIADLDDSSIDQKPHAAVKLVETQVIHDVSVQVTLGHFLEFSDCVGENDGH